MAKEDLDFIKEKGVIVRKTKGTSSFMRSRRVRSSDGKLKYVIRINSEMDEPFVFAHECAHLAEAANLLYKNDEFKEVLKNLEANLKSHVIGKVDDENYNSGIGSFY